MKPKNEKTLPKQKKPVKPVEQETRNERTSEEHKRQFDQLLEDAVLVVKKK